jgi:hypothetical protein
MSMNVPTANATSTRIPEEAYERCKVAINAVPSDQVLHVNRDIPVCVSTVIGAGPEIRELSARIKQLPFVDQVAIEQCEDRALAAMHCHLVYAGATTPAIAIAELNEEAMATKAILLAVCDSVAARGGMDRATVDRFRSGVGYKGVATDVVGLATTMKQSWTVIGPLTGMDFGKVEAAITCGMKLLSAAGLRDQAPATVADVSLTRSRAFTLFVQSYDEVRRAVSFLRWKEGDAESIAPSLYAGRSARRKSDQSDLGTADATPAPGATTPAPAAAGPAPIRFAPPAAPGLPGGSPFIS